MGHLTSTNSTDRNYYYNRLSRLGVNFLLATPAVKHESLPARPVKDKDMEGKTGRAGKAAGRDPTRARRRIDG